MMLARPSRRDVLVGLVGAAALGVAPQERAFASSSSDPAAATDDVGAGPVFSQGGPDAALYGANEGYPVPSYLRALSEGDPWSPGYRVGAFSHFDEIFATRKVARAATPWMFRRGALPDVRYRFRDKPSSLTDYLARNPVTGLLIARDDEILFEHYQYGRTDHDRMLSQSMVKSITGLLVGLAVADGAIKSVGDTVESYVPGFKGSEYGATSIRDLLHMSSGVDFGEERDNGRDLDRLWRDMVIGLGPFRKGTIKSMTQFNHRIAPPGTRFYYASIEPDVLGQVVRAAVGKPLSQYLQEKVWQQIGTQSDATWFLDADGYELPHFGFNATLRDWARLARLFAHDGAWQGRQLIPAQWMIEATTVAPSDGYLAPGKAMPDFGYGYLFFLLPGNRRQFALLGFKGQRILIDPPAKLVMVQTALEEGPEIWRLWAALTAQLG